MKLFLSSIAIAERNQQAFISLVGKESRDIRVALIENGADTYPDNHREWVTRARTMIQATVGEIETFDLRTYTSQAGLERDLSQFDVIWVGGGNVYYLRWISRKSGFDQVIRRLIDKGIVYGGDSAGAIIAGPTIDYFQPADEPEDAPEIILEGFGFIATVVIPHYDHQKYAPIMKSIKEKLDDTSYKTAILTDAQALIINGNTETVVG
jgi:dipeptidase E